jgi:hypothetical protein
MASASRSPAVAAGDDRYEEKELRLNSGLLVDTNGDLYLAMGTLEYDPG